MSKPAYAQLSRENFQGITDGMPTDLYTLRNGHGMVVRFTNLGAKVLQIIVPDERGEMDDVALGYETIEQVKTGQTSMGAFIGRYAGRIGNARFSLDGKEYKLNANNGPNTLHGGTKGSRFRVFEVRQLDESSAELKLTYEDGEENFPGRLQSRIVYRVTDSNALDIEYEATTDAPTVVNFTSHIFFNLAGQARIGAASLNAHELEIPAQTFTPLDEHLIPTGELRPVAGTPMDFRLPMRIGARVDNIDEQLGYGKGYDHNWVIEKAPDTYGTCARLRDPHSGRVLEVLSTEPGLVFYGGNHMTGEAPRDIGKGGIAYTRQSGLCLEPGRFGDSPNKSQFPSAVLRPGETYRGRITYRFSL